MSLFVGKVQFISLDPLASLVSLVSLASPLISIHSRFTIRSKYEHKYRGNWDRKVYKGIFPLEMKFYAVS